MPKSQVCLVPNGASKTTCLRSLFGLLKADAGNANINGINVADAPLEVGHDVRWIGLTIARPQSYGLIANTND